MEKPQQSKNTEKKEHRMVRILSTDIEGKMKLYVGLTKIKGVSWMISNAICKKLGIDKSKKIGELSEKEMESIIAFLKAPELPLHLLNRQKDLETGEDKHLVANDLDLRKDFDIKRLKKMKSYRGLRHMSNLPSRGQRTKGNFRPNHMRGGIKKKPKHTASA